MNSESRTACIISAAGSSSRMGGEKKQYRFIDGLSVLEKSILPFWLCPQINLIVLVISPNDENHIKNIFTDTLKKGIEEGKIIFANGGDTRQESVYNGLLRLQDQNIDYVLIHDAARPWVSQKLIVNVIDAVKQHGQAAPGITPVDTIKKIDADGFITEHLVRANLVSIQTPQGFSYNDILDCHKKAAQEKKAFTDDTELISMYLHKSVFVVNGETDNKKITFMADLPK